MYVPLTRKDQLDSFSELGYSVVYNPQSDGNSQFDALRYWLKRLGMYRPIESICDEIVAYLTQHPNNVEGMPLEYFATMPWDNYLVAMARNSVYGDHITLKAQLIYLSVCGLPLKELIKRDISNYIFSSVA